MFESLKTLLATSITGPHQDGIIDAIVLGIIALVAVVSYFISRSLLHLLDKLVARTSTKIDDILLDNRMLSGIAQLAPALLVNWMLPNFFNDATALHHWTILLTSFYILWAVIHIICVGLSNTYQALSFTPKLRAYAVKGVFQMLKLIAIMVGVIIGVSMLFGTTPKAIFTAIGASAAVLMLVFRDTILGLVASVQLTANNMLHKGDWIVAPKCDANGEVIDVSLTTVKVRNWDNSVSTIPPYLLISDSFRNYEAMRLSGGRRIDRSVLIDFGSVRFLSAEELEKLSADGFLDGLDIDGSKPIINLGLLRRYLESYIARAPFTVKDMLYMVRQLEPTSAGLPLQIYLFTSVTEWKSFERVVSELMDHVYAIISKFHLSIYQAPSGSDIRTIR